MLGQFSLNKTFNHFILIIIILFKNGLAWTVYAFASYLCLFFRLRNFSFLFGRKKIGQLDCSLPMTYNFGFGNCKSNMEAPGQFVPNFGKS